MTPLWCLLRGHKDGIHIVLVYDAGDRELVWVRCCDRCGVLMLSR